MQQTRLWVLALALVPAYAQAGSLSDFEQDVSSPSPAFDSPASSGDSDNCWWLEPCEQATPELPAYKPVQFFPRDDAYGRVELRYQGVASDVAAYDLQVEHANKGFGLYAKWSHYVERNPVDSLDLTSFYVMYRPGRQEHLEADLGVGVVTLAGSQVNTGHSFYIPIRYRFNEGVSLEILPAMTTLTRGMLEVNTAVVWRQGRVLYSIGHRSLSGPTVKLQGPYLGIGAVW